MFFLQFLAFENPSVDLDITVFIQFGLFILVFLALRKFVVLPYLKAYDEREKRTTGAQNEAKALQEEAMAAKAKYEQARQKAYEVVESERRERFNLANAQAALTIETARKEVQADIALKQADFDAQLREARAQASLEIEAISNQITRKILV